MPPKSKPLPRLPDGAIIICIYTGMRAKVTPFARQDDWQVPVVFYAPDGSLRREGALVQRRSVRLATVDEDPMVS